MRNWIIRVAAILIIGAAGAAFYFHTASHSVAFADVVRAVLDIRTGTFKATMTTTSGDGHQVPTQHFEAAFKEPGLERMTSEHMIMIFNRAQGKTLVLQPMTKIAMVMNIKQDPNRPDTNMFSRLRDRLLNYQSGKKENVTEVGRQTIDGRTAVGYHAAEAGFPLTIWADAETALPLKIEMEMSFSSMTVTCTMTDFNWGVPVDDGQFSMEIPAGYTVQESHMDMSNLTESDLITTLQMYTSYMDGAFPAKCDMSGLMEVVKPLGRSVGHPAEDANRKPTPEEIQEYAKKLQEPMMKIVRGIKFVMALPPASDWHYVGKGVKLNAPNTPIAWYRPEKSQTYRVIYADLTVSDVPPDQLPQVRAEDAESAKPQ